MDTYSIDLNSDEVNDFEFIHQSFNSITNTAGSGWLIQSYTAYLKPLNSNGVAAYGWWWTSTYGGGLTSVRVYSMDAGDIIPSAKRFYTPASSWFSVEVIAKTMYSYELFPDDPSNVGHNSDSAAIKGGTTDNYIGIKLRVDGNIHYGWVRFDVAADSLTLTIKDFAYESEAGKEIMIEDFTGVTETIKKLNDVYSFGKSIYINSEAGSASVKIYDSMGKQVHTDRLKQGANKIVLNGSGVYVVSVAGQNGVDTKKVILE
ncbi:MAG: T9SS type A sorting domain-containing protein [Flavobacteriales bacterium]|nr:T9SS type A sorting domain-containing protein [Flavobacteriales bacterium]